MSEPTPSPSPTPTPTPAPTPTPVVAAKPDFLPPEYWDDKAGIKTDEFAKHYGELTVAQQKLAERAAAVPEKPEGYKIEVKLPDGVRVPEGIKFDPSKDPRLPMLLKMAHERGWSNDDVNTLVAYDAQLEIADYHGRQAQLVQENKKLGDNAKDRREAVSNWAKGLKERGELTDEEFAALSPTESTAAVVTVLEKLMAKANGGIPGHVPSKDPTPPPQPITDRWYGTQQKVS